MWISRGEITGPSTDTFEGTLGGPDFVFGMKNRAFIRSILSCAKFHKVRAYSCVKQIWRIVYLQREVIRINFVSRKSSKKNAISYKNTKINTCELKKRITIVA